MICVSLHSGCPGKDEAMRCSNLLSHIGILVMVVTGAASCGSDPGPDLPTGEGVRLMEIASGLSVPLYLTAPAGDVSRLFIVEKTGTIRIVKDGTLLPDPFLDISSQVSGASEQGLLGIAFPTDYNSTGRFVVHYTDIAGDTRVSVFQVSANPDVADASSEQVILSADQPFSNHNGGQIA